MNTAMDDGWPESPGEQTLSFRPVGDEDLAEVQGDDAFDAFGTKKTRKKPQSYRHSQLRNEEASLSRR